MKNGSQGLDLEPRVGIFWLLKDSNMVFDLTPLSEAELYGDCLTHPRGHLEQWDNFLTSGIAPAETDYEALPRGRAVYHRKTARFTVLADRCILARPESLQEIVVMMYLPRAQTEFSTDSHYRCYVCLSHPHLV